jgi:type IV pilus assembly protein PilX
MRMPFYSGRLRSRVAQRGVTLVIALIALIVLLLSGVALIRSLDTSMSTAGNLAFKRDLTNQAERIVARAIANLNTMPDLTIDNPAKNYSASRLATNDYGIPSLLADDSLWTWTAANDMNDPTSGITQLRYAIDRLCVSGTGAPSLSNCAYAFKPRRTTTVTDSVDVGKEPVAAPSYYIYRVSVRAIGPRGTVAFVQSTFMR